MLCISKSLYDLHKYFRFCPQFFNIMKNCVKEQWPKNSPFRNCWLNVMICDSRPKKGGIYLSPWIPDIWLSPQRTHKVEYVSSFFVEKIKSLCSNQSKFNFWIRLHSKSALLCQFFDTNSHLTAKSHNFDIKCQSNFCKLWLTLLFWDQV